MTPTFREVNKKYSTRYYLSLVLIDEGKSSFFAVSLCLAYFLRCSEWLAGRFDLHCLAWTSGAPSQLYGYSCIGDYLASIGS